jgi:GMP synthase-like glutamine amidotransferase
VFGEAVERRGHRLREWIPAEGGDPDPNGFAAALVFGGGMHVDQEAEHAWLRGEKAFLRELLERGTPVLGVCLGSELLAEVADAPPRRAEQPEIGWHVVELTEEAADDPLLRPLPRRFEAFQWHSYEFPLPPAATALARSPLCLQAYRLAGADAWGLQFHAEVTQGSVESWLRDYRKDDDAVRAGVDTDALRAETERRIAGWNELGRGICERFLAVVESRSSH